MALPGRSLASRVRGQVVATSTVTPELVRSGLLGAATGLRSQIGMAAVLVGAGPEGRERLPRHLRRSSAVRSALTAVVGELIVDKSPKATSRLLPGPLAARIVLGGLAAASLAQVERRSLAPSAVAGALAAVAAAKVGHDLRARIARKVPDLAVALAEDAVTVVLAAVAVGALRNDRAAGPE